MNQNAELKTYKGLLLENGWNKFGVADSFGLYCSNEKTYDLELTHPLMMDAKRLKRQEVSVLGDQFENARIRVDKFYPFRAHQKTQIKSNFLN